MPEKLEQIIGPGPVEPREDILLYYIWLESVPVLLSRVKITDLFRWLSRVFVMSEPGSVTGGYFVNKRLYSCRKIPKLRKFFR